jgi:hypothetical protein
MVRIGVDEVRESDWGPPVRAFKISNRKKDNARTITVRMRSRSRKIFRIGHLLHSDR